MLRVPLLPVFAYPFAAFGGSGHCVGHFSQEILTTAFMIMLFVFLLSAEKVRVAHLFLPPRMKTRIDVSTALPLKMRTDVLNCVLLRSISDCVIDSVSAFLTFAQASKID